MPTSSEKWKATLTCIAIYSTACSQLSTIDTKPESIGDQLNHIAQLRSSSLDNVKALEQLTKILGARPAICKELDPARHRCMQSSAYHEIGIELSPIQPSIGQVNIRAQALLKSAKAPTTKELLALLGTTWTSINPVPGVYFTPGCEELVEHKGRDARTILNIHRNNRDCNSRIERVVITVIRDNK